MVMGSMCSDTDPNSNMSTVEIRLLDLMYETADYDDERKQIRDGMRIQINKKIYLNFKLPFFLQKRCI